MWVKLLKFIAAFVVSVQNKKDALASKQIYCYLLLS